MTAPTVTPTLIYDIDLAKDVRVSLRLNPHLADKAILDKVNSNDIADDDLLYVTKTFNTPTIKIIDVKKITPDFVSSHIRFR